jgi:hypothetical protein
MGWGLVCEAHPHVRSCCTIVVPVKCRNQTPSCILYFSLISLCLSSHSQSLNQEGIFYATSSVVSPTQLTLLPLGMTATTHYAASTTLPVTLSLVALISSIKPSNLQLGGLLSAFLCRLLSLPNLSLFNNLINSTLSLNISVSRSPAPMALIESNIEGLSFTHLILFRIESNSSLSPYSIFC